MDYPGIIQVIAEFMEFPKYIKSMWSEIYLLTHTDKNVRKQVGESDKVG